MVVVSREVKFDMENEGDGGEKGGKSFLVEALLCIIERDHREHQIFQPCFRVSCMEAVGADGARRWVGANLGEL